MANTGMLVSMKPTSVDHSGTSASVNDNGGVDFSAVTSLSLNGVFTSDYDNYLMVVSASMATSDNILFRLRAAGTDNSTANSYVRQLLDASSTSVVGARVTSDTTRLTSFYTAVAANGFTAHIYGPALAQPTAYRTVTVASSNSAVISDYAGTHNQSTSYDGFTIYATYAMTGNIHVFGYRE